MRKRMLCLLAGLMAVSMLLQFSCFAEEVQPAAVAPDAAVEMSFTGGLYNGETADLRLSLKGVTNEKIGLFQAYLVYDTDQMEYKSGAFDPAFASKDAADKGVELVPNKPGHIFLYFRADSGEEAVDGSEGMAVANIEFKVKAAPGTKVSLDQPDDQELKLLVYHYGDYTEKLPEPMAVTMKGNSAVVQNGTYSMSDPSMTVSEEKLNAASVKVNIEKSAQNVLCIAAVYKASEDGKLLVAPLQTKTVNRSGTVNFTFNNVNKTEQTEVYFMLWDSLNGALKPLCSNQKAVLK